MSNVVVTGFGPFGNYKTNPSWEVAKALKEIKWDEKKINLITEEIPVVYQEVENRIPKLWGKYQPTLMVHIGVSGEADDITLELSARKNGYDRVDVEENLPEKPDDDPTIAECITTCFDAEKIAKQFNGNSENVKCSVSCDAGLFLCEYIYFTSLKIEKERTIFIHVPVFNKIYTVQSMAEAVGEIILLLLDEIQQKCPIKN